MNIDEIVNKVHHGDALDVLRTIPSESVSLIWSSPPYNVSIDYGTHQDNMIWADYLEWQKKIWTECGRILKIGGRLAINFDLVVNHEDESEYFRPLHAEFINMMRDIPDMKFRTEIMWCKTGSDNKPDSGQVVGRATAWGSFASASNPVVMRNHEYILVWSKGQWGLPGDSENSDMTKEEFFKYTRSTWCVQPETRKIGGHPVPFSEELTYRVIKLFSYRGDIVMDPFNGSGTTTSVAARYGRNYIGIDHDKGYCEFARARTSKAKSEFLNDEQVSPYVPRSKRMEKTKESSQPVEIEFD